MNIANLLSRFLLCLLITTTIAFSEPTETDLTAKLTTYITKDSPQLNEADVHHCAWLAIDNIEHAKRQVWVDTLVNNQQHPADSSDKAEEKKAYDAWFESLISCIVLSGTPDSPSETTMINHLITILSDADQQAGINLPADKQLFREKNARYCVKTSLVNVNKTKQQKWVDAVANNKTLRTNGPNAVAEMQAYAAWFEGLIACVNRPLGKVY